MKQYSEELCEMKHSNIEEKLNDIKEDLKIINNKIDDLNIFKLKLIGGISVIVSVLTIISEIIFKFLTKGN